MDVEVRDVSTYIEERRQLEAQLLALQDKYRVLLRLCHDVITESEEHKKGDYLHFIKPGTWRRLVATVSKPRQAGLFGKGEG